MTEAPYRQLDPAAIAETIGVLARRIAERFPRSGLGQIAADLHDMAASTVAQTRWVERPHVPLRIAIFLVLMLPVVLWFAVGKPSLAWRIDTVPEFIQTAEAALASIVFIGAAVLFLVSLESRIKRSRVFLRLHELRAFAHIVDMHQLTKSPERVLDREADTASSPARTMTAFELGRYFEYCSELLSLINKLAALYAQATVDHRVIEAVDDIEDLTNGMSGRIWEKLTLLHQIYPGDVRREVAPSGGDAVRPPPARAAPVEP